MMLQKAALAAGLALGLVSGSARASVVIDFTKVGTDMVAVGSGTLNITGLTALGTFTHDEFVQGSDGFFGAGGAQGDTIEGYSGVTGPTNFGTGGIVNSSTTTGDLFSVRGSLGRVFLDPLFTSGSSLSFSSTFSGQSFATLGVRSGTYSYILPNDSITLDISSVPLPASAPMFGAALVALAGFGYGLNRWVAPKGKKAAAAA